MPDTLAKDRVVTFRIEADLVVAMERLRARDGIAASEMIRRALRPWLEKKGVLKPSSSARSPRSSTSRR